MPLTARARLTMPMFIAALILVGGFIAIAWTVQWATAGSSERITQVTNAGSAGVNIPVQVANNVAGSLPAFSLDLDGAVAIDVQAPDPRWLDPAPLERIEFGIGVWVYLDNWWLCSSIDREYNYRPVGAVEPFTGQDAIEQARWNALTFRQQQNVKGACDR